LILSSVASAIVKASAAKITVSMAPVASSNPIGPTPAPPAHPW
jgi:hypothetical protein